MVQDPGNDIERECFELVQADEDVATLDAGFAGRPLRIDFVDQQAAAQLRVGLVTKAGSARLARRPSLFQTSSDTAAGEAATTTRSVPPGTRMSSCFSTLFRRTVTATRSPGTFSRKPRSRSRQQPTGTWPASRSRSPGMTPALSAALPVSTCSTIAVRTTGLLDMSI